MVAPVPKLTKSNRFTRIRGAIAITGIIIISIGIRCILQDLKLSIFIASDERSDGEFEEFDRIGCIITDKIEFKCTEIAMIAEVFLIFVTRKETLSGI